MYYLGVLKNNKNRTICNMQSIGTLVFIWEMGFTGIHFIMIHNPNIFFVLNVMT